jgi:GT2 family glycosyltransferase
VLFKQKPDQSPAYTSVHAVLGHSKPLPDIFIYDNSPQASPVTSGKITYLHDPLNAGVSKAYNAASVHAASTGKTWMLFLDQDTEVTRDFFDKMQTSVRAHSDSVAFVPRLKDRKGLISPFRWAFGGGIRTNKRGSPLSLASHRFVNSGLLIKLSAFQTVGGYDPDIPLDFSDIAFGERLRAITRHFHVIDVVLTHDFSDSSGMQSAHALARFHQYCAGAIAMSRKSGFPNLYAIRLFFRACRLCLRHKNTNFLSAFFQHLR